VKRRSEACLEALEKSSPSSWLTGVFLVITVTFLLGRILVPASLGAELPASTAGPADRVYRNGVIFTADAQNKTVEALAIRDGRIVYVGGNDGVAPLVGTTTKVVDLKGRFLMPGLIDGHMHPLEAGIVLLKCSLNYESLTIAELQQRIQGCLDKSPSKDAGAWLEVVSWFQESMRPAGVKTSRATLDALKTTRPIIVRSSFGHTVLANSRALALAKITASTPDPIGGKIWRDAGGEPRGVLEDAAFAVFSTLIPKPNARGERDSRSRRPPGDEPTGRHQLPGCGRRGRGHGGVRGSTSRRRPDRACALRPGH